MMDQKRQTSEVLTLCLQGEVFAIDADIVREILDVVPVTEVPNADPFVNGIINVRGRIVPLADLRIKFGMAQNPPTPDTRIIVIEVALDGEPTIVSILADKVFEVTEISADSVEATPRLGMKWNADFIRCIGKRDRDFIIVLDIERVFSSVEQAFLGAPATAA